MLHAFPTRPPRAFFVAVAIDPLGDRRSYRVRDRELEPMAFGPTPNPN